MAASVSLKLSNNEWATLNILTEEKIFTLRKSVRAYARAKIHATLTPYLKDSEYIEYASFRAQNLRSDQ